MSNLSDKATACKPNTKRVIKENIPQSLKDLRIWVLWTYQWRDNKSGDGKWTKVPLQPVNAWDGYTEKTGLKFLRAKSDNPKTWSDFDTVWHYYDGFPQHFDGIGVVLKRSNLCGGDLDNSVSNGIIKPWAKDIIDSIDTYTEFSPSGKGLKYIHYASFEELLKTIDDVELVGDLRRRKRYHDGEIETYDATSSRFFTVTGWHVPGTPLTIEPRQQQFETLYKQIFATEIEDSKKVKVTRAKMQATAVMATELGVADDEVVQLCLAAKNGDKFKRLFMDGDLSDYGDDHSRADMALVSMLVFWCGSDVEKIDRIFRASALCQDEDRIEKWERLGTRTINAAVNRCPEPFDWDRHHQAVANDKQEGLLEAIIARRAKPQAEPQEAHQEPSKPLGVTLDEEPCFDSEPLPRSQQPKPKRRGYRPSEIRDFEDPRWIVKDHIIENSFVGIFGAPGSFKSFYALDLAFSIASGTPFLGTHAVEQGPVLYVYAEGRGGIKRRLLAWERERSVQLPDDKVCIVPYAFDLSANSQDEVTELLRITTETLGVKPSCTFLDTLSRNFGAGDENATKDMKAFVDVADTIREATDGVVVVVHHTGKDKTKKERGSNVLRASADTLIQVERDSPTSQSANVSCEKQKDAETFAEYEIVTEKVSITGGDSLVLRNAGASGEKPTERKKSRTTINDCRNLTIFSMHEESAITTKEVAMKWNVTIDTARKRLYDLHARELINRIDGGTGAAHSYYLSTRGCCLLDANDSE